MSVLDEHVARFNAAIRSRDFGPMLRQFAHDAELAFEGVPVGPFHGRDAIAQAYRDQPPDDEVRVLGSREDDGVVVADYAWAKEPDRRAGELRLAHDGERIHRLVVTFE